MTKQITALLIGLAVGFAVGFLANSRGCAGGNGPEFGVSLPPPPTSVQSPVYEIPRDLPREILEVTVSTDTIRPEDVGKVKVQTIRIYLPQERGQEPLVQERGELHTSYARSSLTEPFSALSVAFYAGASVSPG